ncbi:MAG: sulfotransferase [Phycisphaeraceae bacterium]|nr:sulfotransferase [Phycisphaeraceae bacterium]
MNDQPASDASMQEPPRRRPKPWTPTLWAGMRLSPRVKLLWRHRRGMPLERWFRMGVLGGAVGLTNSVMSLAQRGMWGRRIDAVTLPSDPLLILGHWRTGTTLLHDLLAADDRMVAPTTLQCFAPEHWMIARWTRLIFNWAMPTRRPMDDMTFSLDRPQEDEFALLLMGHPSPYQAIAFDHRGGSDCPDMNELSENQRQQWTDAWLGFLRSLLLLHPGARLALKSPTHTTRLPLIHAIFPEARYVYLVRDPRKAIPSTIHLWKTLSLWWGMTRQDHEGLTDHVIRTFRRMDDIFERDRHLLDPTQVTVMRYEDLIASPMPAMERLYRELNLGDLLPAKSAMTSLLERNRDHRPNRWSPPTELLSRIESELGAYMSRYGYR